MKRVKAVDDRDQTVRINQLRDRISFGYTSTDITGKEMVGRLIVGNHTDNESSVVYCDADYPESDGTYRVSCVAIKKRLAQTMDDKTLCMELGKGLIRSAMRGHRQGLLDPGPPPEWIT
jgi:hypothetical protein